MGSHMLSDFKMGSHMFSDVEMGSHMLSDVEMGSHMLSDVEMGSYMLSDVVNGYLRHKSKTSQNVSSEAQVKKNLFCSKVMFRSEDIQVLFLFNHPMIYQICDVMLTTTH